MTDDRNRQYEFGPFRVDPASRQLLRAGVRVPLTRKAFETLLVLLEKAGRPVSKTRLLGEVWPDTIVTEATLTQNVYTLRKALKDADAEESVIETLPGVGYRFVAKVKRLVVDEVAVEPAEAIATLAVLPFRSLDREADQGHLGLCLADALITRLSRLGRLVVRPSSAMFRYADREVDPVIVGRELRVDAVLEGTLLRSKGRLRANVQLVDVRGAAPLWAQKFDVPFVDVFSAEDEISEQVVTTIFAPGSEVRLGGREPGSPSGEAYEAYVRGRFFWNKRTREGLDKAVDSFRRALELAPDYAEAYAGLADCYALRPVYADVPPRESFPKAKEAAERARQLRDGIPEPHASLAYTRFLFDWDWEAAEAGFARAIEIDPHYSTAHHWSAFLLSARGRHDEAIASAERALALDPLSLVINADLALILHFAARNDEAIRHCHRTLELEPSFAYARFVLGLASVSAGRVDEGVESCRRAAELARGNTLMTSALGYASAVAGDDGAARGVLAELTERRETAYVPAARFALVHAGLGDGEDALDALERAVEERSRAVVFLNVWPAFGFLRGRPRFDALLGRIGLGAGRPA